MIPGAMITVKTHTGQPVSIQIPYGTVVGSILQLAEHIQALLVMDAMLNQ